MKTVLNAKNYGTFNKRKIEPKFMKNENFK